MMLDYKISITLHKYRNSASIYRMGRGIQYHKNFSHASRKRLMRLANRFGHRSNKIDSNFYFFATAYTTAYEGNNEN